MALSNRDREEIENIIKVVVNGKIDRVDSKIDRHMEHADRLIDMFAKLSDEITPVVEAVKWINTTKKYVMWIIGIFVAIASLISSFKQ